MTLDELQRICDAPLLLGPFVAKWPAKGRGTVYDAVGNVVADYYDEGVGPWIVAAREYMPRLLEIAKVAQEAVDGGYWLDERTYIPLLGLPVRARLSGALQQLETTK